jgi:peptide/nickel transport system substrate-binding protein
MTFSVRVKRLVVALGCIATVIAGAGTPAHAQTKPVPGGTARVGLWQEPSTLNPYYATMYATNLVANVVLEGLVSVDPAGQYAPVLAAEVPSVANRGVSADGKTVTYGLRPGLRWSDGAPVTSADVRFTWEAILNPANRVVTRAGYDLIEKIETPDGTTAILHFKRLYAPFLTLFPYILPRHILGTLPDLNQAPFNRLPVGTGPFRAVEWVSGSHITFERNTHYRLGGRPFLDRLIFKMVPSREVGIAQIKTGEIHALWNLSEYQIPEFERLADVKLAVTSSSLSEKLVLNLSAAGDPAVPHPILGDKRVRQALQYAIDKQLIVDKLLYGKARVGTSEIPQGWASNPAIKPGEFSPAKARQLLKEAGWKDTDGDGVLDKAGQPLKLRLSTTSGDKLRELVEQLAQEQLRAVGVAITIENVLPTVLFGSWGDRSPRKRGTYDIQMYSPGPSIDPDAYLYGFYHSSQIPLEANAGAGNNTSRYRSADFDRAVEEARASADVEKRRRAYFKAAALLNDDLPVIILYTRLFVDAYRQNVRGYTPSPWAWMGWDVQNWYLAQ